MKKLLVLFSLLLSVTAFAQGNQPIGDFSLVDNRIQYIKVFTDSCSSVAAAEKELMMMLSKYKVRSLVLQSNLYMITGSITIDAPTFVTCNFTIEVKSGKYRVICYAIATGNGSIDGSYTKNKGTEWSSHTSGLQKIGNTLSTVFDLSKSNEPKW